ncbi:MAG TPA: DUF488 domain-containing protein [Gammaproteobacteria bacterium]|nr:DUF488 domain-containing protein [Gammaproteobacteria bacterium]
MLETENPASKAHRLFTVGHSNRSLDNLLDLLHNYRIKQLIDVRSTPNCQGFSIFNRSSLAATLEEEDIAYAWLGHELGGQRRSKLQSPHQALATDGFRAYADHMSSNVFMDGINHLTNIASQTTTVIMCAEREASQCHRSLIADYLLLKHWHITHLLDINHSQEHILNPLARSYQDQLVYDQLGQEQLNLSL